MRDPFVDDASKQARITRDAAGLHKAFQPNSQSNHPGLSAAVDLTPRDQHRKRAIVPRVRGKALADSGQSQPSPETA
jgi:hypothetical protein